MLSVPRILLYGTSAVACLNSFFAKETNMKVGYAFSYLFLTGAIMSYDNAIYQNFLSAPGEINAGYGELNSEIEKTLQYIKDLDECARKQILHSVYIFESVLRGNTPENLLSGPIIYGPDTIYNGQNRGILLGSDKFQALPQSNGYIFQNQGNKIYNPTQRKEDTLKLLPEPTKQCKKKLKKTIFTCIGIPCACFALIYSNKFMPDNQLLAPLEKISKVAAKAAFTTIGLVLPWAAVFIKLKF